MSKNTSSFSPPRKRSLIPISTNSLEGFNWIIVLKRFLKEFILSPLTPLFFIFRVWKISANSKFCVRLFPAKTTLPLSFGKSSKSWSRPEKYVKAESLDKAFAFEEKNLLTYTAENVRLRNMDSESRIFILLLMGPIIDWNEFQSARWEKNQGNKFNALICLITIPLSFFYYSHFFHLSLKCKGRCHLINHRQKRLMG